jgi:hypothetical protein
VAQQQYEQAKDPTFPQRFAAHGKMLLSMSVNGNYEVGEDGAPNWPCSPQAFQNGIVADGNPYQAWMP